MARHERLTAVRRVLVVVLLLNLGVAAAKLVTGWLTDSIALLADGFHSLTDTASNVVGLVGISLAARPPDKEHPYGHQKFETLSALLIGGFLALTAWEVLESCLERLQSKTVPQVANWSLLVIAVTIVVNLIVSAYEHRRAKALGSLLLEADAMHTRSDVFVSIGVLASLVGTRLGYPQLDMAAALLVTAFIAHAAFRIARTSAEHLVDTAAVPAERISELAVSVPGVESSHKVRTRGRGQDGRADLHIQVRADLRIDEAHAIGHQVADRIRDELGVQDIVVHVEPSEQKGTHRGPDPLD